jgi:hypothetical protein
MKNTLKKQIENLGNWYQTIDFGNEVFTNNNISATGTAEQVYQDIKSFLPKHLDSTHYLDIGCSAAYFIVRLLLDGAGDATGIDVDIKCIKQANFIKSFFLKDKDRDLKIIHGDFKDYLISIPSNVRYDAIIASSVLYPRTNISKLDRKYLEEYFYQRAKLLTDKTYTIIARWRQEDNCRNGDIFYEQLQKFNYQETGRKKLCNRTLVRYQRNENLKLSKNHRMVFPDDRTRGWDEIISAITDCKNMRVWNRVDERKDLSNFITYVSPSTLTNRNFISDRLKKIYNTTTELEFISKHRSKLFESVKKIGIQQPPVVRKTKEESEYLVDDGNHRVGIAKALKFDKIPVIILEEQ